MLKTPLWCDVAARQIKGEFIGRESVFRWNIINKNSTTPGARVFPNVYGFGESRGEH
jgi:hypothetical protein